MFALPLAMSMMVVPPVLGGASYYALDGNRTANGEVYSRHAMTAAHRTLKFGTMVRVKNVATGQTVIVRINDRGPYHPGRIIDLSEAAFKRISPRSAGVIKVRLDVLKPGPKAP